MNNPIYLHYYRQYIESSHTSPNFLTSVYDTVGGPIPANERILGADNWLLLELLLKNIGADTALCITFTINDKVALPKFSIAKNDCVKFVIMLNHDLLNEKSYPLKLTITYSDVASIKKYKQEGQIVFYEDDKGLMSIKIPSDGFLSPPEEI